MLTELRPGSASAKTRSLAERPPGMRPRQICNGPYCSARIHRKRRGETQEKLKKSSRISQGNWTDAKVKGGLTVRSRAGFDRGTIDPLRAGKTALGLMWRWQKADPTDPRRALFA